MRFTSVLALLSTLDPGRIHESELLGSPELRQRSGRGEGRELGACPAATETACDGLNGGTNAGRICWAVSGTFCGGQVQGVFAEKEETCAACDFFNRVKDEEGFASFFRAWKRIHGKLLRKDCWDAMECGRGPGGSEVGKLGVCPAATDPTGDGLNGGTNSGRICWAVTGTFCGGEVRGTFAEKKDSCGRCAFFKRVINEEGTSNFVAAWKAISKKTRRTNCWEAKECGRGPGGHNVDEIGVCPAAVANACDGLNGGKNAGRICWAVSGTFCGNKVQGTFAEKESSCMKCDFYRRVKREEGSTGFLNSWDKLRKLPQPAGQGDFDVDKGTAKVRQLKDTQWVTVAPPGES